MDRKPHAIAAPATRSRMPEPRERDYIFVGAYTCFGIWIGIGAAGLIAWVRQKVRFPIFAHACTLLAFTIPAGIFIHNYPSHDRTGDQVPRNLAYNLRRVGE